jgi:hypothetical protein
MYSPTAVERRQCTATTKAGRRCRGYALWAMDGQEGRVCVSHSNLQHRGPQQPRAPWDGSRPPPWAKEHTRRTGQTCRCQAYPWPHRKASGGCQWPQEPLIRCTTPPSTHRTPRLRRPKGW